MNLLALITDARARELVRFMLEPGAIRRGQRWAMTRRVRGDDKFAPRWCEPHEADALIARGLVVSLGRRGNSRLLEITPKGIALAREAAVEERGT